MSINSLKSISKPYLKTTNPLSKKWYVCFRYTNNQNETKEFKRTFDLNKQPFVINGIVNNKPSIQKERYKIGLKYVKEIQDLLNNVEFDANRGVFIEDATKEPVIQHLHNWYNWKQNKVKHTTHKVYKSVINLFENYLNDTNNIHISLEHFGYRELSNFLNNVQTTTSNSRYNFCLIVFKNFYNYIINIEGINVPNPTKKISNLTVYQTTKHSKYSTPNTAIQDLTDYNYYLGFMAKCVYYTLHRIETLTALQFKDFDLEKGIINIPATKIKTAKKLEIRIHHNLLPTIREYVNNNDVLQNDYFFGYNGKIKNSKGGKKLDINMFGKSKTPVYIFTKIFERYRNLKTTNKLLFTPNHTLYGFKHSGVIYYKDNGLSDEQIIKLTGHSNTSILQTYSKQYEAIIDEDLFYSLP